jgi:hypothetical protein
MNTPKRRDSNVVDSFECDVVMYDVSLLIETLNEDNKPTGVEEEIKIIDKTGDFPFKFCSPHGLPVCALDRRVSLKYKSPRTHTLTINQSIIGNGRRESLKSGTVSCTVGSKDFDINDGVIKNIRDAEIPLTYETSIVGVGSVYDI